MYANNEETNDFDFVYIKITYFWLGMLEIIFGLTMITTAIYRSLSSTNILKLCLIG